MTYRARSNIRCSANLRKLRRGLDRPSLVSVAVDCLRASTRHVARAHLPALPDR